jgi:uncharacterized LabA/DUF88 family protein
MQRVAGFIDAGYFWVQLSQQLEGSKGSRTGIAIDYDAFHDAFLDYVNDEFANIPLLRIYCYDGPSVEGHKTPFHQEVERLDDFKLRLGTRTREGSQKAVDGLIIADMISLTQNRSITHAFLVSGDADLVPGVIAAQAQGLRVHLLSLEPTNATSPHLRCEVDKQRLWGTKEISRFASKKVNIHAIHAENALGFENVVNKFYSTLTNEQKSQIQGTQIPHEIDKRLLRLGLESTGKALEESQKRQIRDIFLRLAGISR